MISHNNKPRVSIIIVNYNGRPWLEPCLSSVQQQDYQDYEVLLVDNASTDGSAELVAERFPWVRLIQAEKNLGFAGGNNLGFAHSSAEYLVLLNNDTAVEAGWLRNLVGAADTDGRVGAVGAKIVFYSKYLPITFMTSAFVPRNRGLSSDTRSLGFRLQETICVAESSYRKTFHETGFGGAEWDEAEGCSFRWGAGVARVFVPYDQVAAEYTLTFSAAGVANGQPLSLFVGDRLAGSFALTTGYAPFRLKLSAEEADRHGVDLINNAGSYRRRRGVAGDIGFGEVDSQQFDEARPLNNLCGCSVLLKRQMLDQVGSFDDRLFMYYEDTDLFWRAQKKGWTLFYCPASVVRHRHAASSQEWSPFFVFHVLRNQFLIVVKNGTPREVAGATVTLMRPLLKAVANVLTALLKGTRNKEAIGRLRQHLGIVLSAARYVVPFLSTRWKGST